MSYTAGTVSARIELDTSDFDKEVKSLQGKIDQLKTVMSKNGLMDLDKQVTNLQNQLAKANETIADYKTQLKNLRNEQKEGTKSSKEHERQEKNLQKTIEETTNDIKKETEAVRELNNENKKSTPIPKGESEIDIMIRKREKLNRLIKEGNLEEAQYSGKNRKSLVRYTSGAPRTIDVDGWERASNHFERENGSAEKFKQTLTELAGKIKEYNSSQEKQAASAMEVVKAYTDMEVKMTAIHRYYEQLNNRLTFVQTGYNHVTESIIRTTQVLDKFNFKLLDGVDKATFFYNRVTSLASAMWKLNSGVGTRGAETQYQGRQTVGGYSNYLSQITKINKALDEMAKKQKIASGQLGTAWKDHGIGLNQYYQNLNKINKELERQAQRVQKVKNAQLQLQYYQRTDWLNQYKGNMKEINAQLEKQTQNTRNAGRGITSFNNGIVQTAHSGRILSNTLYQIRGALLSLKMIFTAMGGMALWGFATQIADGVKETFKAKNEMEAQLKQNSKVSDGGIDYFNKSLDTLTQRFKKINKYSIGETVSSIGLEFNLSAKEMADFSDIVAMIQSEYVRAGRKESEAALAVKDILQGEFQRLSRETGVGKEELIEYGWNGDKTDIKSLTDALRKAAKDRNWDVFAAKATSLNDVMTIMKSRFSETGADITQSVTPLIVGAFNEIIGAIDKLGAAWNSMGSFNRTFISMIGTGGLIGGLLTALPMITKGMGLAEISTIGWGKSLLTAALNLNKMEVAHYGFRKALAATIAGTNASALSNTRWTKSIMGRILGVKQSVLIEKGYGQALVHNKALLKEGINMQRASFLEKDKDGKLTGKLTKLELTRSQRLAYLTNNIKLSEAAEMSRGKAILRTVFSMKALKVAILGITTIGLASWFAGVAVQADLVKNRINTFKEVLETGGDKLKSAKKDLESYTNAMEKYDKNSDKYKRAAANKEIAEGNIKELELSNRLVKSYDAQNKAREKSITEATKSFRQYALMDAGFSKSEATEKTLGYADEINAAQYEITRSYNEQYNYLANSSKHLRENVKYMNEAKVSQEDMNKYIAEYSTVAVQAGEHLKQFYQGDVNALFAFGLDQLKLVWIDLWNNPHFINFWKQVEETWKTLQPTLNWLVTKLQELGNILLDLGAGFLSTDVGKWTAALAGAGTVIGYIGLKIGKWVSGSDSVFQVLKKVGGKLKEVADGWKKVGDEAEGANKKTGGDKSSDKDKSTGGITGADGKTWKKGEFTKTVSNDAKNIARSYAKAAVHIALAIGLVTEAIALMMLPMGALAATGSVFERLEPQIRKGIEGLKVVAPTVIAIMVPAVALAYVMERFNVSSSTLLKGSLKAAVGIAIGIGLVTEALLLLNAPLLSLALLGGVYDGVQDSVNKGITAMKVVNEALEALVPWIPVFIGGIALAAVVFAAPEIGLPALAAAALGIAAGMLLVSEAIIALNMPLAAIAQTGQNYPNLDGVKQGAEAIKVTSEALKYVSDAMTSLTLIDLNLLAQHIADVVAAWFGIDLGTKLTDLTKEGGVLDQLSQFTTAFNSADFTIAQIDQAKVANLALAGDGIKTIGDAMLKVKTAMENLPEEFKNSTGEFAPSANLVYNGGGNVDKQGGSASATVSVSYFDQFKKPISDLKTFVDEFNQSEEMNIQPVDEGKLANIEQASSMIERVNAAVERVKTTMQNVGQAGSETAFATGGWFGQAGYNLMHMTGLEAINNGQSSGSYKSSLGSSLQQMEDVIDDIFTFQSNISAKTGATGENANVDGMTAMVTTIQTAISNLAQSLSDAVPQFEGKGNAISSALVRGVNAGLGNLGGDITSKVASAIDAAKPTAETYGKGLGWKVQNGFKTELKVKDALTTEISNALNAIGEDKQQEFYDKGKALGDAFSRGFKDGAGINSPGYAAQAMQSEVGYIGQYLNNGIMNLPSLAGQLGSAISAGLTPSLDLSNLQFPDLSQWTSQLSTIPTAVNNVKTQVGTGFTNMSTSVGTSLGGIATSAKSRYAQIVANTRTSLSSMQSATVKNIGNIKTSWHGMQSALIASAENIKTQTGQKINKLKTNLGEFWNKIKHPDQLISGAAGGLTGTVRRRFTGGRANKHYAGGTISRSQSLFKGIRSRGQPSDNTMLEYFKCMMEAGKPCYAGGWNFNWTNKISKKFKGWNTHFGAYHLDDFLNVGKFENSNFPVKGRADVAKQYIYDVISATKYSKYFNSNFGEDPVAALRAGAFNCWDGTNIVLAIARAFGFEGGRGHGTWNGIGHVWASIPGLGIIDPTAIQGGYGFTSPKVKGYAGAMPRRYASSGTVGEDNAKIVNNTTEVHIHGNVYGVDDLHKEIEKGVQKANRKLFRKSYSGV